MNNQIKQKQKFWFSVFAHNSFQRALNYTDMLLSKCSSNEDPLYLPISISIHAFYSRPFKRMDGIQRELKLDRDWVPHEYRGMHDAIVTFRDKVFMHSDANKDDTTGVTYNSLELEVCQNGDLNFVTIEPLIRIENYSNLRNCILACHQKSAELLHNAKIELDHKIPQEIGLYKMNLQSDPAFIKTP